MSRIEGSCGGLVRVDTLGRVLTTLLLKEFSNNLKALYFKDDTFYYSGEFRMGEAKAFSILKINKYLTLEKRADFSQGEDKFYNYFVLGSSNYNNRHIMVGSSFCNPECPQTGHLLSIKNQAIDSALVFQFTDDGYTLINSAIVNSENELVLYCRYKSFVTKKDSIKIIRMDTAFNQVFEWSIETRSSMNPRGCISENDDMIVNVLSETKGGLEDIYSISPIGNTNWIFKWPRQEGGSNILRIKAAKNGDIFVMGQRWGPGFLDDLRNVAFIMRLTKDGMQKWVRFFKLEDQSPLLSNSVADLEELENGDLLCVGSTERIYYDPIISQERPDQDIFWARIGGDGCINDDCGEEYIVTATNEILQKEKKINIYPNPSISEIVIDLPTKGRIEILDGNGRLIESKQGLLGKNNITLPIDLKGLVFVKCILADGQTYVEKVIKL